MAKQTDDSDESLEPWPAVMRIGTVARYLDCSTTTVNKMITEGAFPAIKYGPGDGMRGVLREDVDTYIEGLRSEMHFPEIEFEFSRPTPTRTKGPGSRLLFLKAAIKYFQQDRDSWKRRALYSERYLSQAEKQLLANLERLLPAATPDKARTSTSPSTPPQYRGHSQQYTNTESQTAEEYVESIKKSMPGDSLTIPVRGRPGEFATLSATEVARRIAGFWEIPAGPRGYLVFGGWITRDEVAQATDEELLTTEGIGPKALRTIRQHIPRRN